MRSDAVDLAEVGAAGESMERAADVEGGGPFGTALAARLGQWCSRQWFLLGQLGEQRLDFAIALGDLPKQELIGGEVLLEREQVLGPIVAGQGRYNLCIRGVAATITMGSKPLWVAFSCQDAAHDLESGLAGDGRVAHLPANSIDGLHAYLLFGIGLINTAAPGRSLSGIEGEHP